MRQHGAHGGFGASGASRARGGARDALRSKGFAVDLGDLSRFLLPFLLCFAWRGGTSLSEKLSFWLVGELGEIWLWWKFGSSDESV